MVSVIPNNIESLRINLALGQFIAIQNSIRTQKPFYQSVGYHPNTPLIVSRYPFIPIFKASLPLGSAVEYVRVSVSRSVR
jgi:hypothetical protein